MALATTLLLICVVVADLLREDRDANRRAASKALTTVCAILSHDIARNIEIYDLSLVGASEAFRQPGVDALPIELRRSVLFDRAADAPYLGSIRVLDRAGDTIISSRPRLPKHLNFAERDYFQAQLRQPNLGLFIGRPFTSKIDGEEVIGLSRRLTDTHGAFDGVVVGTLQLAYFQRLLEKVSLSAHGSITVLENDGTILARRPYRDGLIGQVVRPFGLSQLLHGSNVSEYVGPSPIDSVERLMRYERIGDLPLVLVATEATADIYADWWRKAVSICITIAFCCLIICTLALALQRELRRRHVAEEAFMRLAGEDSLTLLPNRRTFDAQLQRDWVAAVRAQQPLSLLMVDADEFKTFNDTFGHLRGDEALRTLATCFAQTARRPRDTAARLGGEEFALLLPSTPADAAYAMAERLLQRVRDLTLANPNAKAGILTVSIGVSTCLPTPAGTSRQLVAEADDALYAAKHAGRNRVATSAQALRPAA